MKDDIFEHVWLVCPRIMLFGTYIIEHGAEMLLMDLTVYVIGASTFIL